MPSPLHSHSEPVSSEPPAAREPDREQQEHAEQAERALDEHDREPGRRAALAEHVARDDAAHDIAGDRAGQVVVVEERDEVELRRARAASGRVSAP